VRLRFNLSRDSSSDLSLYCSLTTLPLLSFRTLPASEESTGQGRLVPSTLTTLVSCLRLFRSRLSIEGGDGRPSSACFLSLAGADFDCHLSPHRSPSSPTYLR